MHPSTLLLVDDHPGFVRAASRFPSCYPEVAVAGTAGSGQEALDRAAELRPDVVLLDLAMPGMSGLEVIPRLRALLPGVGVIAVTFLDTEGYRQAALLAGADRFVPKSAVTTELLPAIHHVMQARDLGDE